MKTTTIIEEVDNGYIIRVTEEGAAESTKYTVIYRTWAEVQQFLDDYYGNATPNTAGGGPERSEETFFGEYGSYPTIRR